MDGYSGQTTDELIALEGVFRTDSIVLAFEQAISRMAAQTGAQDLTTPERAVLAIEALEREVNNDGYDGLFRNASQQVPDVVSSLMAIGCDAVADLTRSAIAVLRIDGPITPAAVESAMEDEDDDRDDRLEVLDRAYYETAGDLADPLFVYIRTNRDQIDLTQLGGAGSFLDRARRSLHGLRARFR